MNGYTRFSPYERPIVDQLHALAKSIEHYERELLDPGSEDMRGGGCACCQVFANRLCVGCPVSEVVGSCYGLSYRSIAVMLEAQGLASFEYRNSIAVVLGELKSIYLRLAKRAYAPRAESLLGAARILWRALAANVKKGGAPWLR